MKNLVIMVLALSVVLFTNNLAWSQSLTTAFTWQGKLSDGGIAANGLYDFEFHLFDLDTGGIPVTAAVVKENVPVYDGYFTVNLDFGNAFDGNRRWLQISVRPGAATGDYTPLTPRQELTATPYSQYAKTAGSVVGGTGVQGGGTVNYIPKFTGPETIGNSAIYESGGKIGIGTNIPERLLHIVGVNPRILIEASSISPEINFKNTGDSPSEIWSLYKDGATDDLRFYQNGNRLTIQNSTGNVGIGATSPWSKLSVGGNGYTGTGIYGEGGDYGIYGFSASGVGVYGINYSTYNEGMLGSSDYGVKGSYGSSGNFGYLGGSDYGVMGKHNNTGNYGYLGGSAYAVCGIASSGFGVRGESSANGVGVSGINTTSGNYGFLGGPTHGVYGYSVSSYGVAGYSHILSSSSAGVYGHSDYGYGVHGSSGNVYGAKAGYFEGNVYVTREMSAENVVDRTPYPKDFATAYDAVMSMERLPDGQYQENNKENQLDHSKLSSFIQSGDGNRDLSATVSCLNEVVKDLLKQNQELKKRLDALEKSHNKL